MDTRYLNSTQQALKSSYSFDGQNVYVGDVNDVSDTILGVTLAVTLSDITLDGSATTKVCIIGDSFGDELIHDDLVFNENGTQITKGRYKHIRAILFNNFSFSLCIMRLTGIPVQRETISAISSAVTSSFINAEFACISINLLFNL